MVHKAVLKTPIKSSFGSPLVVLLLGGRQLKMTAMAILSFKDFYHKDFNLGIVRNVSDESQFFSCKQLQAVERQRLATQTQ